MSRAWRWRHSTAASPESRSATTAANTCSSPAAHERAHLGPLPAVASSLSGSGVPVQGRAVTFDLADQELQLGDLIGEGGLACFREGDPRAGAFSGVALLDRDEPGAFQHAEVLGEVSCSQFQVVAQVAELDPPRLVRDGEDAEPDPLVDGVVEPVGGMAGHAAGDRSGRWARAKPMPPSSSTLPWKTAG